MNALIIMAHGSRRTSANQEFLDLVNRIGQNQTHFQVTLGAFLEQSSPTLMQACEQAIKEGHDNITIYPLFFNCGRHVEKDIPIQVSEVMSHFESCKISLLPYFGSSEGLAGLVVEHLNELIETE